MPRLKYKPIVLDENQFVDWLLEVYYYRMMDQGMRSAMTALMVSTRNDEAARIFLDQVRAQLSAFELTFPLTKIPMLYGRALRETSICPQTATVKRPVPFP